MKCKRYIIHSFCLLLLVISVGGCITLKAAEDPLAFMEQLQGVSLSPDGTAWTTDYLDKTNERLNEGYTILTGEQSTLGMLQKGEHYYKTAVSEIIPVKAWVVTWSNAQCIHSYDAQVYKGFQVNAGICGKYYNNGWTAICANCEEAVADMLIYAKSSTLQRVTHMPGASSYLYICPHCYGLEQGRDYTHYCKEISYNCYAVKYEPNSPDDVEMQGYMADTKHMYNNAQSYEGRPASEAGYSDIRLRKNTYTCSGYTFTGWNTKADGTGEGFSDEQEIINLTEKEGDTVILYAQWRETFSTLLIDASDGTYCGEALYTISQRAGTGYSVQSSLLSPAPGYTVKFASNGGSTVADIHTQKEFLYWNKTEPVKGVFENDIYYFPNIEGNVDRIKAEYIDQSFILPESRKAGEYLAGWYSDALCSVDSFVGNAGDKVSVSKDTTLYAKWEFLSLTAIDNYHAFQGKGAVDLNWNQQIAQNAIYKIYQSENQKDWKLINALETEQQVSDFENQFGVDKQGANYSISDAGYYQLSAYGAKGADYNASNPGGKGGFVCAEFWLQPGDVLTFYAGNAGNGRSGGTNGNGGNGGNATASTGTGGGAASEIYLTRDGRQVPLLIAGGGSGAGINTAGENGGLELTSVGSKPGYNSSQGGGGGAIGGMAEVLYKQTTLQNPNQDSIAIRSDWSKLFPKEQQLYFNYSKLNNLSAYPVYIVDSSISQSYLKGGTITVGGLTRALTVYATEKTKDEDHYADKIVYVPQNGISPFFDAYQLGGGFIRYFSAVYPVNGNTNIVVSGLLEGWGEFLSGKIRFKISDAQKGTVLHDKTYLNGECHKPHSEIPATMAAGSWGDFNVSGVEQVKVEIMIYIDADMSHTSAYVLDTFFYGKKINIGEYAKGGSSFINTAYGCRNVSCIGGANDGAGSCKVKTKDIGYISISNLENVFAPDKQPPDVILEYNASQMSDGKYKVVWNEPKDFGTDYYHKVESFINSASGLEGVSQSNITRNNLVSRVRQYHYYIDASPTGNVLKTHPFTTASELLIMKEDAGKYLHIAPIDAAGNLGDTTNIKIMTFEEEINQQIKISTEKLFLKETAFVYAYDNNTYYVKADDKTEHIIVATGKIDKAISTENQIEALNLIINAGEENVWMKTTVPKGNVSLSEEIFYNSMLKMNNTDGYSNFFRLQSALAVRKKHGLELTVMQNFTVPQNGAAYVVYPEASMHTEGIQIISDPEEDVLHGITIIPDSEPPHILGMEALYQLEALELEEQTVTFELSAYDDLSGLEDFYVTIENQDNHMKEEFHCTQNGKIYLVIDKENPLFIGKIIITAMAVDRVGNGNVIGENGLTFTLQTKLYRERNPEENVVKTGDGVILDITTSGYVEKIEVLFPEEMTAVMPELNKVYEYEYPYLRNTESIHFNVPLGIPEKEYEIVVGAYKEGQVLKKKEVLLVVSGNVLEELRTRIRNNG